MAIDVPVSGPETVRLPLGLARLGTVSARLLLGGIVAIGFGLRVFAVSLHTTPSYFPDEYIYGSIARSLAEAGRPLIRSAPAHFPALLEPLLAAPFWLFHDPQLAYRLTQAENALFMSLAAIPVYLLVRRLGLGAGAALAAAGVTLASPDLFFAAFVLADALTYLLVLTAVYAGVCALTRPTARAQLAFALLAGLSVAARVQYVVLPAVFVGAALIVERGRLRAVVSRFRLTLAVFATPLAGVVALGPARALGYYSSATGIHPKPFGIVHWIAVDGMLIAYSAGWVLIPGALVGLAYALAKPRSREEAAFGALVAMLAVAVLGEAGLWASNGSQRFQERYLMVLLPLVLPAFLVYLRRGRPARAVVCVLAVAMLGLSARVPLSGYSIGDGKQDSPLLFAVFWLERRLGVANGSMLIAILAAVLSCLAAGIAFRARLVPLAIGLTVLICGGVGAAAVQFDRLVTDSVRSSYLPRDAQWIDHAHVGDTVLVQTPATPHVRAHEELFWNRSLKDLLLLAGTSGVDSFRTERVEIARGGTILRGGKPLRRPLAISNFAVNVQLSGATRVASGGAYDLWTPAGTPRLSLFAGGLYHDHWLARAGHITVWPDGGGRVRGVLRLVLSLPKRTEKTPLRVTAPGLARKFSISPGERKVLEVPASARGPWTLRWRTSRPGYVDDRPISVQAETPTFTRLTAATCPTLPRSTLV